MSRTRVNRDADPEASVNFRVVHPTYHLLSAKESSLSMREHSLRICYRHLYTADIGLFSRGFFCASSSTYSTLYNVQRRLEQLSRNSYCTVVCSTFPRDQTAVTFPLSLRRWYQCVRSVCARKSIKLQAFHILSVYRLI